MVRPRKSLQKKNTEKGCVIHSVGCFFALGMVVTVQGGVPQTFLSPLAILSMEKTMVAKVISESEYISSLKIFPETGPKGQVPEKSQTPKGSQPTGFHY